MHSIARRSLGTLVALSISATCLRAQDVAMHVGCYSFDRDYFAWVVVDSIGSRQLQVTHVIQLLSDSMPTRDGQHRFALRTVPSFADTTVLGKMRRVLSAWRPAASDSVVIIWSDGLHGNIFRLHSGGDTLTGVVHTITDVDPPGPPARATTVVRMACVR